MRLPLVWRPAPSAAVAPADITDPVGLLDLAPTFCAIAGVPVPDWMDGVPLPTSPADRRERVLTEWDSRHPTGVELHLQTIHRDDFTCTRYEPGTVHDGTEGELYDLADDPLQQVNRWDDPSCRTLRDDLVGDLLDSLPPRPAVERRVEAPV